MKVIKKFTEEMNKERWTEMNLFHPVYAPDSLIIIALLLPAETTLMSEITKEMVNNLVCKECSICNISGDM